MYRRYACIIIAGFGVQAFSPSAHAAEGAGAAFLKIVPDARPVAMGETFAGASGRVDSLAGNPAGLARIDGFQQTFSHTAWIDGVNVEYFALARRIGPVSVFGAGLEYVAVGDIDRADRSGNTLGSYNAYDLMGALSYARIVGPRLDVGGTVKIIKEKIEANTASGFAADLGAQYRLSKCMLGFAVKNIGSAVDFTGNGNSNPLPMTMRGGGAWLLSPNVTVAADVNLPSGGAMSLHCGGEYRRKIFEDLQFAGRAGLKTGSSRAGFSLGMGAAWREWTIDYAFVPYGEFGSTHRLSMSVRLVPGAQKAEPAVPPAPVVLPAAAPAPAPPLEAVPAKTAQEMYQESLAWFNKKAAEGRLTKDEQLMVLERIKEKFEFLSVDLNAVCEEIEKRKNVR